MMRDHRFRGRALLLLAVLCFWLVGCELEEALTFNADGSGTYVAHILIDKAFSGAVADIKAKATSEGYRIVQESETPDRKVLVISKDFRDVSELSDDSDRYGLIVDQSSKWRRSYSLDFSTRSSSGNGIGKRTVELVFPVSVLSSTAGTVNGRTVVWDATSGGSVHVEAAGFLLPFGLTPLSAAVVVAAITGVLVLLLFRRRRGPQTCSSCGQTSTASAKFCGSCGAELLRPRRFSPAAVAVGVAAIAVVGLLIANLPKLVGLIDRVTTPEAAEASVTPAPETAAAETVATDTTAVAAALPSTAIATDIAMPATLPQGVFQGSVVAPDVIQLDSGMRVELSGNQDGGCPFFGAGHNGEVNWDIQPGDRLEVDGNVFRFTEENKWAMTPKAPFGVMANRITILTRK